MIEARDVRIEDVSVPDQHRWCASRFRNFCKRRNIITLGGLAGCSAHEMLKLPNFGRKTLRTVEAILAEHGLVLRP